MRSLPFLPALFLFFTASAAHAGPYEACVELVARDADTAYDHALRWGDEGGGAAALHCGILALTKLELYDAAATRLEQLAARSDMGGAQERALILQQAGASWLKHGDVKRAIAAYGAGIEIDPQNTALLTARGRAYLLGGEAELAIDDLNRAAELAPQEGEIFLLRARAERQTGALESARRDIAAAESAGADPLLLRLERGLIAEEMGDKDSARKDWLYVQANAKEDSAEAEAARAYLARMDVTQESAGTGGN